PEGQLVERARQERRRADEATRAQYTDDLTGFGNNNAWLAAAERVKNDPNKHVLLMDMNGAKNLNDAVGYTITNEQLADLADITREVARKHGISERELYRFGGDENIAVGNDADVLKQANDEIEKTFG